MTPRARNLALLLTSLLILQLIIGFLLPASAYNGVFARMLVYAHLTIHPLNSDMPMSNLMGPVLGLLVFLCGVGGSIQLLWKGNTHFLRAFMIFTFIWIVLRGGLYLILLFTADQRWPLVLGFLALVGWGWLVSKIGNPLFRKTNG